MAIDGAVGVSELPATKLLRRGGIDRLLQASGRLVRAKPLGALGGLLIVGLVATAVLAPVLAPYDPIRIKSADRLQPPSLRYLLGTDDFGRDILSRVIHGARISVFLGLGAVGISTGLATVIGVLSGYYGGRIDTAVQRCIDTLMAFPGLVVLLTIMAMLGQGLGNVILALGIGGTAGNARIIRSAVLAIKENQYIEVARATGCRDWQIIVRYILPNIAAPIMVVATLGLSVAILSESSLSFLGFGVPPPTPSWGAMLSGSGRTYMLQAPWMAIFPGMAISLAVFGFNMLGDALRDLLDPKLRGRTQGRA
jgi:peptide/nickel transport system permease protein